MLNEETILRQIGQDTPCVYILRCGDGTLYAGWTNRLTHRLAAHRAGRGARYTRGRGPVALVYARAFDDAAEAMRREAQVKKLSRARKQRLIEAAQTALDK
ncbi:MAG: GIY-YIG nuclease family protein [Christensenellales bacterium]